MGLSVLSFLLNFLTRYTCTHYPRGPIIMSPHVGYRFSVVSEIERCKDNIFLFSYTIFQEKCLSLPQNNR